MWRTLYILEGHEDEEVNVRIMRCYLRDTSNPLTLPNHIFLTQFRLSKPAFEYVLRTISLTRGQRRTCIPPIQRLAATLMLLSTEGYQNTIGSNFICPMAKSVISQCVNEVLLAMENKLCPLRIKFPKEYELKEIKLWFFEKYQIPGGCIDGTHLYLLRPRDNEYMYLNRKQKHSLNAMIICDHEMRIRVINASYGGAAHDAFVWGQSEVKAYFENQQTRNMWLLGDSGYPLEPWLITPYRSPRDPAEKHFNDVHSKARSIIERCFGRLKGVWRVLLEERKARYSPQKVIRMANVCAALHNVAIHYKVQYNINLGVIDDEQDYIGTAPPTSSLRQTAEYVRNKIKNSLN